MTIAKYLDYEPKIAAESYVADSAELIGQVELKTGANIWPGVVIRGDINRIVVGEYSNIQDNSTVHIDGDIPTILGDYVTVGHAAVLHACTIEDGVLIGMGAIVLDDAVIGKGSIIGAGAVVAPGKKIPPNSLVMGVPGKVIGEVDAERAAGLIEHAKKYWRLAQTNLPNK